MTDELEANLSNPELQHSPGLARVMAVRLIDTNKVYGDSVREVLGLKSQPSAEGAAMASIIRTAGASALEEVFEDVMGQQQDSLAQPVSRLGTLIMTVADEIAPAAGAIYEDDTVPGTYRELGYRSNEHLNEGSSSAGNASNTAFAAYTDRSLTIARWAQSQSLDPIAVFQSDELFDGAMRAAIRPDEYAIQELALLNGMSDGGSIDFIAIVEGVTSSDGPEELEEYERKASKDVSHAIIVACKQVVAKRVQRLWGDAAIENLPQDLAVDLQAALDQKPRDIVQFGRDVDDEYKASALAWQMDVSAREGIDLEALELGDLTILRLEYEDTLRT